MRQVVYRVMLQKVEYPKLLVQEPEMIQNASPTLADWESRVS